MVTHESEENVKVERACASYKVVESFELGAGFKKLDEALKVLKVEPATFVNVCFL